MKPWIIVICILAALVIAVVVRCIYELHCITAARYELHSEKIRPGDGIRAVFVSDLHARSYGKDNKRLIDLIRQQQPDIILVGGDLNISKIPSSDKKALAFLRQIADLAPVYYAPGNHEKAMTDLKVFRDRNHRYMDELGRLNIRYMSNAAVHLNESISLTGLDASYSYYRKISPKKMSAESIKRYVGTADKTVYNIILAHFPDFFHSCADAGYDLVLSGHYHGGAVRLPGKGGLISPQFKLFPEYSRGQFERGDSTLIVSAGCGSHTMNIRLFNKPEILVIDLKP